MLTTRSVQDLLDRTIRCIIVLSLIDFCTVLPGAKYRTARCTFLRFLLRNMGAHLLPSEQGSRAIWSVHYGLPPFVNSRIGCSWWFAFALATLVGYSERDDVDLVRLRFFTRDRFRISTYIRISLSYVIVDQQFERSRTHTKLSATPLHLPSFSNNAGKVVT